MEQLVLIHLLLLFSFVVSLSELATSRIQMRIKAMVCLRHLTHQKISLRLLKKLLGLLSGPQNCLPSTNRSLNSAVQTTVRGESRVHLG